MWRTYDRNPTFLLRGLYTEIWNKKAIKPNKVKAIPASCSLKTIPCPSILALILHKTQISCRPSHALNAFTDYAKGVDHSTHLIEMSMTRKMLSVRHFWLCMCQSYHHLSALSSNDSTNMPYFGDNGGCMPLQSMGESSSRRKNVNTTVGWCMKIQSILEGLLQ